MMGVTVEGNGGYGVLATWGGVALLGGCAVSGNAKGDYVTFRGGRIEGVDPSRVMEDEE